MYSVTEQSQQREKRSFAQYLNFIKCSAVMYIQKPS